MSVTIETALLSTVQNSLVDDTVHRKMACVELSREKAIQIALTELGRSEKDLEAEVDALKEWLKTQKHLPEIPDDHNLINSILSNKFHMEKTKKNIEMYYTMRSILPEIFKNTNPKFPHMKNVARQVAIFPLGVTEAGHSVSVVWINMDKNEKTPDPYDVTAHGINSIELITHETVVLPGILIYDYESITMDYVTKITPVTMRKTILPLRKMFSIRFREAHLVNVPGYAEILINMFKQFLKPKIRERIIIHNTVEELQKYLPKSILPTEYGGDLPSLRTLADKWNKNFEKYAERFDKLDEMKVDETLRSTPLEDDELLGIYGHFRKLDID